MIALAPGAVFDGEAVDKATDALTIALGQRGYPFAAVRPHLMRNPGAGTIDILFTIDNGARQYIERIVLRGNNDTREYVFRREFDIVEGDAYNRALVERAEKRLRALPFSAIG
jgi:outer membrane protein insertion porin family